MKKSQLRQIIREEISKVLKEQFEEDDNLEATDDITGVKYTIDTIDGGDTLITLNKGSIFYVKYYEGGNLVVVDEVGDMLTIPKSELRKLNKIK